MRVVGTIPHERFTIQIFQMNGKYSVKIELDQFEQIYKIGEVDVLGINDVKAMVNSDFLNKCLKRFVEMREDWYDAFTNKNKNN